MTSIPVSHATLSVIDKCPLHTILLITEIILKCGIKVKLTHQRADDLYMAKILRGSQRVIKKVPSRAMYLHVGFVWYI